LITAVGAASHRSGREMTRRNAWLCMKEADDKANSGEICIISRREVLSALRSSPPLWGPVRQSESEGPSSRAPTSRGSARRERLNLRRPRPPRGPRGPRRGRGRELARKSEDDSLTWNWISVECRSGGSLSFCGWAPFFPPSVACWLPSPVKTPSNCTAATAENDRRRRRRKREDLESPVSFLLRYLFRF